MSPFIIPNSSDAFNSAQAEPDKVDMDILVAGIGGDGVISGCAVTAQGSPDMTLAVAAGTLRIGGTLATVASGNVTITAANGTNPRFDLVVVNNAGTKSVTAGTAAVNPVFPAVPANSVVLAGVYVPANDTAIGSNQIVDKRVVLADWSGQELAYAEVTGGTISTTNTTAGNRVDAAGLLISPVVGARPIIVEFWGNVWQTTAGTSVAVYIIEAAAGDGNQTPILSASTCTSSTGSAIHSVIIKVRLAPSAGIHTYKIQFVGTVGGGTSNIGGSATNASYIRAYNV